MGQDYEKETRSIIHKTQEKINKTAEELKVEIEVMKNQEILKEKKEKKENLFVGLSLVFGLIILNIITPFTKDVDFLSFNFNPKVGPIDVILFLAGVRFIWRGIRK